MKTPFKDNPHYVITAFGECGWLARISGLEDRVSLALYANTVAAALRTEDSFRDCVAGLDSVAILFDPHKTTAHDAQLRLERALNNAAPHNALPQQSTHTIPVCYGDAYGPDLEALSKQMGLSSEAIIKKHTGKAYRVMTLGFAPGFAYLGPLDKALEASRLETPRARVAKGSVGVAGLFTGIYPLASPGGWRIIGRTPINLFSAENNAPFLLNVGDTVEFTSITADELDKIEAAQS